jgi:hypothetical protein
VLPLQANLHPAAGRHRRRTEAQSPGPISGPCRLDIGAASSRGKVRDRNEDSLFMQQLS